jgi:sphinganine-1-phosphate aldolase
MDAETTAALMGEMESNLKPYRQSFPSFGELPAQGLPRDEIIDLLGRLRQAEADHWEAGRASGAVYNGDQAHIDFVTRAYALHSQSNPLHPDIWPSASKFEAEIVAMTARMLHAEPGSDVCGTVTSGGTESILIAMKAYRDWARTEKGIEKPEILAPSTAHAAFDKAAHYFGMSIRRLPVGKDFRADVEATRAAINPNTVVLVGSSPPYPHGIVDPIAELSELAAEAGLGFHTDGCLGGFLLPWIEKLGYPVPAFDFRLPGVTSISADTHKYGYAPKGTSVVLYRSHNLRRYQYFGVTDWPGGLYCTPTMAGSRPGGLSAACWASMLAMGENGYLEAARRIMDTAVWIRQQLDTIGELRILGDPLFLLAFASDELDIYQLLEAMTRRGWGLNGLHLPPAAHLCLTLRHTLPGVREQFVSDLREVISWVKANPRAPSGVGPVYGMAAMPEMRGMVNEVLNWYMDTQYRV